MISNNSLLRNFTTPCQWFFASQNKALIFVNNFITPCLTFSGKTTSPETPSFQSRFYTLLALPFPDQPRLARRDLAPMGGYRGRAGAFSFQPPSPRINLPRVKTNQVTHTHPDARGSSTRGLIWGFSFTFLILLESNNSISAKLSNLVISLYKGKCKKVFFLLPVSISFLLKYQYFW